MNIAVVYSNPSRRILKTEYGIADEDSSVIARMVVRGLKQEGFQLLFIQYLKIILKILVGLKLIVFLT